MKFKIYHLKSFKLISAFAFYTVACGHGAKWSSNIWRQYEVQSISLELVTGVFACGTVAYRHVALAYLKHELQRISLTLVLGSCDTVAYGHGARYLVYLKHAVQNSYIVWTSAFAFHTVACGHGAKWCLNNWRQYEVRKIYRLNWCLCLWCRCLWAWGTCIFEAWTPTYSLYTSQCFCCIRYSCSWAWAK